MSLSNSSLILRLKIGSPSSSMTCKSFEKRSATANLSSFEYTHKNLLTFFWSNSFVQLLCTHILISKLPEESFLRVSSSCLFNYSQVSVAACLLPILNNLVCFLLLLLSVGVLNLAAILLINYLQMALSWFSTSVIFFFISSLDTFLVSEASFLTLVVFLRIHPQSFCSILSFYGLDQFCSYFQVKIASIYQFF